MSTPSTPSPFQKQRSMSTSTITTIASTIPPSTLEKQRSMSIPKDEKQREEMIRSELAITKMELDINADIKSLENNSENNSINFDVFFDYLVYDCCGCFERECDIEELKGSLKPLKNNVLPKAKCNTIRVDNGETLKKIYSKIDKASYSKIALVLKFIELFERYKLIVERQNMYFLLKSNMRFKWNNIKMLTKNDINFLKTGDDDGILNILKKRFNVESEEKESEEKELLLIKALFWYFRKVVVDSVVSDIITMNNYEENVKAMSVGSTKLTSDYDITLDGTYKKNSRVIRRFNRFIEVLFMDDSESVFDTNIYGVSFIKGEKPINSPIDGKAPVPNIENEINSVAGEAPVPNIENEINSVAGEAFTSEHKCYDNSVPFHYIDGKEDVDFVISQHVWALIKLLLRLKKIQNQDEKLYELFLDELSNNFSDNLYFKSAQKFVNNYDSDMNNYEKSVDFIDNFLFGKDNCIKDVNKDSKYCLSNFIGYANYNGSETYLTNGAFLDVVVNNQMCKDINNNNGEKVEGKKVKLDVNSYLDSFIENMSDLMTHYHKEKYLTRAKNAFNNILKETENKFNKDLDEKDRFYKDVDEKKMGEYINAVLNKIEQIQQKCSEDILDCQSFIIGYYILECIILVFNRYMEWSKISRKDLEQVLKTGIDRFDNLKFKIFKESIVSKILKSIRK